MRSQLTSQRKIILDPEETAKKNIQAGNKKTMQMMGTKQRSMNFIFDRYTIVEGKGPKHVVKEWVEG
jgi:hypothetical protein